MDCYLGLHSARAEWTTTETADAVVAALQAIPLAPPYRAPRPGELQRHASDYAGGAGEARTVRLIRMSPQMGFRDLVEFRVEGDGAVTGEVRSGGGGGVAGATTVVRGMGRSLDYHMWSACPCCQCEPAACFCRYVACFLCCCGTCPTKDWGQNQRTLDEIAASLHMGLAPRSSEASLSTYAPPASVDAAR